MIKKILRALLLLVAAFILASCWCCCSGPGFPKHTGPHGEMTMEYSVTR